LLFSRVDLMFWQCVLLDEAIASWGNFFCVFCFIILLIISKQFLCQYFFKYLHGKSPGPSGPVPYRPWDTLYMKTLAITHLHTTQLTDTLSLKRF
jgi:hypothetical protein